MILSLITIPIFALLNRCRGTDFYSFFASDAETRLIAAFLMAIIVAIFSATTEIQIIETFISVSTLSFLAMLPAWDNYWSAAIGNPTDRTKSTFAPVDFIMKHFMWLPLRAWGTIAMGLRSLLYGTGIIAFALLTHRPERAMYALATILCGIPYLAWGYVGTSTAVPRAEYTNGAWLGFLYWMVAL